MGICFLASLSQSVSSSHNKTFIWKSPIETLFKLSFSSKSMAGISWHVREYLRLSKVLIITYTIPILLFSFFQKIGSPNQVRIMNSISFTFILVYIVYYAYDLVYQCSMSSIYSRSVNPPNPWFFRLLFNVVSWRVETFI